MSDQSPETQVDIIEAKIKEMLTLIDVLKRTVCLIKLPKVISSDDELKELIEANVETSENHETALVDIENFQLKNLRHFQFQDLRHIKHKTLNP